MKYGNTFLQKGFTLVELLVVFSIMATLATVSFASFSSYNTSQQLTSVALDVKNTVAFAKSQAVSQVDTCTNGNQFVGYTFLACCTGSGSCPSCLVNGYNYEVDENCMNGATPAPIAVEDKKLPNGMSFYVGGSGGPYTYSFSFNPLSGSLSSPPGNFKIQQGTSATKTVTISSQGVVQIQ